jgi:hypothetical protein
MKKYNPKITSRTVNKCLYNYLDGFAFIFQKNIFRMFAKSQQAEF